MTPRKRKRAVTHLWSPDTLKSAAVLVTALGWNVRQAGDAQKSTASVVQIAALYDQATNDRVDSLAVELWRVRNEVKVLRRALKATRMRLPEEQVGPPIPDGWIYQPPKRRGFFARLFGG